MAKRRLADRLAPRQGDPVLARLARVIGPEGTGGADRMAPDRFGNPTEGRFLPDYRRPGQARGGWRSPRSARGGVQTPGYGGFEGPERLRRRIRQRI
jgi:hypothetical protein